MGSLCKESSRSAGRGGNRHVPEHFWDALAQAAIEMRDGQHRSPIRLDEICGRLGIEVVRQESVERGKAFLEWDRARGSAPVVLLPIQEISRWDRFCVAHELGHFVLISSYDWNPGDPSGYWQTEAVCDYFARELLLPSSLFQRDVACNSRSAMEECSAIATSAKVPWIQAAKKMTERNPALVFLRLQRSGDPRFTVTATSLSRDRGRGTKVNNRTGFAALATAALEEAGQQDRPVGRPLTRDDFAGSKLGSLFGELRVSEIFMEASAPASGIKLAALV